MSESVSDRTAHDVYLFYVRYAVSRMYDIVVMVLFYLYLSLVHSMSKFF